jgi:hypothetical protein
MKILPLNSKVMTFKGEVPVRRKTVIDNAVFQQVNKFTLLECKTLYQEENDMTLKIRFLQILGIFNNVLKQNKVKREYRLKLCNTVTISSFLYGCKIWKLKRGSRRGIKTAEMKLMRRRAGYSLLDHRRYFRRKEISALETIMVKSH